MIEKTANYVFIFVNQKYLRSFYMASCVYHLDKERKQRKRKRSRADNQTLIKVV